MESMAEIDLNFLAKQLDRVLNDTRQLRDDMKLLIAMMTRVDGTLTTALIELRDVRCRS
jgi:hypothetical protein